VLSVLCILAFLALTVWFATHRDGNTADNLPEDSAGTNPPVNGTSMWA
jgi:hypothetical protein